MIGPAPSRDHRFGAFPDGSRGDAPFRSGPRSTEQRPHRPDRRAVHPQPAVPQNWAEQDVHEHRTGRKIYRHPELGELDISYDVFEMPGEPGLSIATYTAEEGTPTADKLALLASWAAADELDSKHRASRAHRRADDIR